ncbi:MAG: trigger factor [Dehalococcoidales bacterium]|nr:trigger factor [Dehalococcoidales bacterium]
MKVTKEKIEKCQAFLTIEVDKAEVEESLDQAYRRLVKRANVPGFRKGKAPRPILERHVGREKLLENALDSLIPEAYEKALKEEGIEAIGQPQIEVTQTEPLVFKAIVPLKPSVKLGDYHHLKIEPITLTAVTDEQVDAVIQELRHQHANWESIELRSADFGDSVVIDVESSIEGKQLADQKRIPYKLERGSTMPVPGFVDQLVGMKKAGVKEFKIMLSSDYPSPDLAGKEVLFKVIVSDVSQEILPELNAAFVSTVKPGLKTWSVDALRQEITAELKQNAENIATQKFEEKVIDAIVGISGVEFPPVLVDAEINQILSQRFPKGQEEMEAYLKRINKTPEAFHQGLHPFATSRVTRSLVLGKVSEVEKIEVTDADIELEIAEMIKDVENVEETREILNTPQNRESIKNQFIARKTVQRLVEIASAENESAEIKTAEAETGNGKTAKTETVKKTSKKKEEKK